MAGADATARDILAGPGLDMERNRTGETQSLRRQPDNVAIARATHFTVFGSASGAGSDLYANGPRTSGNRPARADNRRYRTNPLLHLLRSDQAVCADCLALLRCRRAHGGSRNSPTAVPPKVVVNDCSPQQGQTICGFLGKVVLLDMVTVEHQSRWPTVPVGPSWRQYAESAVHSPSILELSLWAHAFGDCFIVGGSVCRIGGGRGACRSYLLNA